jgi:hypothetical protein
MKHFFYYTDHASQDLLHAAKWYEQQQTGLGLELLEYIDQTIATIDSAPLAFQKRLTVKKMELRFVPLQKFPYAVVYAFNNAQIIIFAIWAHKKDPKKLKKRLK